MILNEHPEQVKALAGSPDAKILSRPGGIGTPESMGKVLDMTWCSTFRMKDLALIADESGAEVPKNRSDQKTGDALGQDLPLRRTGSGIEIGAVTGNGRKVKTMTGNQADGESFFSFVVIYYCFRSVDILNRT
jgi:hypothetical protein